MIDSFQTALAKFAQEHKNEILKKPEYRNKFHELCASANIDPLLSSSSIWEKILGIGDFYYELSVQIVDVCITTRSQNGGIIELSDLITRIEAIRRQPKSISPDDIKRAIEKMKILKGKYSIQKIGQQTLIQSVPSEFNNDHLRLIQYAQSKGGYFTKVLAATEMRWASQRIDKASDELLRDGIAMIDEQGADGLTMFWIIGIIQVDTTTGRISVVQDRS
ncbi:MAG: putative Vacuolar protein sorting-associated protein 22 [Streblomastix strix]|uniref:Putative Vacuolar protein sorting-associated protein 22 n=1 Tax=Streblomastix strix TaxID=222440 RepID=A0A5J4TY34_9EUKA|nr:MAG: putative Vacuolar protein sorting-associated protein 22 [Streblomastix strix]